MICLEPRGITLLISGSTQCAIKGVHSGSFRHQCPGGTLIRGLRPGLLPIAARVKSGNQHALLRCGCRKCSAKKRTGLGLPAFLIRNSEMLRKSWKPLGYVRRSEVCDEVD